MVTARFLVGTNADDAILRVHEKIRANIDRIPVGIPEPLIVGRGINDVAVVVLTLSPKPEAAARWTDKDLYRARRQAARRTGQGRQCRPDLYLRRQRRRRSASSPIRRSSRCSASRCSNWSPRCATPTARSRPAPCATTTPCATSRPGRRSPAFPTSACCWSPRATTARSMCATSPRS